MSDLDTAVIRARADAALNWASLSTFEAHSRAMRSVSDIPALCDALDAERAENATLRAALADVRARLDKWALDDHEDFREALMDYSAFGLYLALSAILDRAGVTPPDTTTHHTGGGTR